MFAAFLAALALAVAPAESAPSVGAAVPLEWSAPKGCPSRAEVREAIDAYLGRERFGPGIEAVRVSARVDATAGGHRLAVQVSLPEGGLVERAVDAKQCGQLGKAAGLIIAVALDPLRVQEVAPPPSVEPESPPARPAPADDPPAHARAKQRSIHADLRFGGGGEIGTLPRLGGGAWLGVAVVGRRFRAELNGQWWAPREVSPFRASPGAGASIQLGSAGVRGCFVPSVRRFEFPSCAALELGAARARGIGLEIERVSRRPWVVAAVGQELVWVSRRRLLLWVGADALLNLVRPRFVVDDLGTVAQAGWAGFRFVGGLGVRI